MTNVVFCDFDGTISRRDVGYNLFHHFSDGRNDELIPDWKSGRISSRECLRREAAMISATEEQIEDYLSEHQIDPTFASFADLIRENESELYILSDGLDLYIETLLNRGGIEGVDFKSNSARIDGDKMTIIFPYENKNCQRCGNCKGERISEFRESRSDELRIIFIGDGFSDECAIGEADVIFAKKDLEQLCLARNIEYCPYDDFEDVSRHLKKLGLFAK